MTGLWDSLVALFAQNQPAADPAPQGGGLVALLPGFVLMAVVFYLLLIRPQQKEQKKRQQLLTELKKNDHVVTVSGIYGVVTNIRPEADEVTIRVDEDSNTKIRMKLSSVQGRAGETSAEKAAGK